MAAEDGSLPFKEQIKFFRGKLNLPTRAWTDLWGEAHDHAFVVAGAMKAALIEDLRAAVDKAIAQGTTLAEFRKDFDRTVAANGWQFNGSRGWRTRVIYETNLRTSYQAGRLAQMREIARARPFWRYRHNDSVEHPRPIHQGWDGIVLRHDDAWWRTHYPPNGWGCKCYIETFAREDLPDGKTGPDTAPPLDEREVTIGRNGPSPRTVRVPRGIDPGWEHQPGRSWVERLTPQPMRAPPASTAAAVPGLSALPRPRTVPASRILPGDLSDTQYVTRFLREFGLAEGERQTLFEDVTGEHLLISDALLRERSGRLKIDKRGRARNLLLFADAIKAPDEIWEDWAEFNGRRVLRRRYIAQFRVRGQTVPALAVFETGAVGWSGVTAHSPDTVAGLQARSRRGNRVYRRGE